MTDRELCSRCEGNGVIKIHHGVSICPRCDGRCYEPVAAPVSGASPSPQARPDTGPMQFGDDWPGVFIKGDNALLGYVPALEGAVASLEMCHVSPFVTMQLRGLLDTLKSCAVVAGKEPAELQRASLSSVLDPAKEQK